MSEFRFRRYVMKGARAEGICVRADSIDAAIPKAIDIVYKDERPVTILIADNLADKIEKIEEILRDTSDTYAPDNPPFGVADLVERIEEALG